jgi:hypothetical protein
MSGFGRACTVCNGPVPAPFRAPQAVGAPDLDLRAGEPTRSTLHHWISTCPRSGAAAPDLADGPLSARGVVGTPEYRAIAGSAPRYALPFLRWAAICRADGRAAQAAEVMLQAAWAANDAADDKRATEWRRQAAELWTHEKLGDAVQLVLIDVYRRAGMFDEAATICAALRARTQDENAQRLLAFQAERIAAKDRGRHLISSALRPPARTPHVAHTKNGRGAKPAGKGLLGRLFGGG